MKIAYLFPGQGSQVVGMGKDLAGAYKSAADAYTQADAILPALWGDDTKLTTLCFDGPEDTLRQTIYAQPALFTTSAAALSALREARAPGPDAVAGHSVGEYAALLASGVFDFETGLRLVTRRAQEMQRAARETSGTMAAVLGLTSDVVREICAEASAQTGAVVDAANFNAPIQIVISGEIAGVEAASALAKDRGAKRVVPLSVSGAFHSQLMTGASRAMAEVLARTALNAPTVPIIANVTADYAVTADDIRAGLASQVAGAVRWHESMERLVADGFDTFIEVGHGNVLSGLIKRLAPEATLLQAGTPADIEKVVEILGKN